MPCHLGRAVWKHGKQDVFLRDDEVFVLLSELLGVVLLKTKCGVCNRSPVPRRLSGRIVELLGQVVWLSKLF